ncbi:AMP-binding protein [Nocardia brasiliensis]|uniref:AMP-binding protein n=1 Tax=Nocardia brasiliensis TaxID=37326 RepID=UPI002458F452|nr:AMP-binding protein [Nocardia brasiliensis]
MTSFDVSDVVSAVSADGFITLASRQPLDDYPSSVLESFRHGSETHPRRKLVCERGAGGWKVCTWGQARRRVDRIAEGLLRRGVAGKSLIILSHNSIAHLLVSLAAYTIGSPVVPVSTAYSLQGRDRLHGIVDLVDPAVVFAEDPRYAAAVREIGGGRLLLSPRTPAAGMTPLGRIERDPTPALAERATSVSRKTTAKIMFTSGSTAFPKGVINTHGMLSANQQQLRQLWPSITDDPPILLDWLPWSHTFGGNHNVNMVLVNGGTLWIDTGRPTADLIHATINNLLDVSPTLYFNVPVGYSFLIPVLERNPQAAKAFFARLRIAFFAAAVMPQQLCDRLQALAARHDCDMRIATAWGMTETAPAATATAGALVRSDSIGAPLPGVEIKLVPGAHKYEMWVRGPNVTPGYYRQPELTNAAFDADGYLRTGDAGRLADPAQPALGLLYDGRIAEDFKLATGTFVSVGRLRTLLVETGKGLVRDAVICGHDGNFVAAMVWLASGHVGSCTSDGLPDVTLRAALTVLLQELTARTGTGSAQRIERLLILTEPADLVSGEITDKGHINQRAVRERRRALVDELLCSDPSPKCIDAYHPSGQPGPPTTADRRVGVSGVRPEKRRNSG